MTSQEMIKHLPLPPGKWFWNVAPLGEKPNWIVVDEPYLDPEFRSEQTILGYEEKAFLSKQYKP